MTGTVAIFTGLIIWNDFFLSLIFLNGTDKTPLPVAVYTFVGAFASRWNLIFAAVIVSLLPIMVFFLFAQRQLIRASPAASRARRPPMAPVTFANVGKTYPDGTRAVIDLNLEIADGEFVVFVGPSGCGKTTALRMVAGLEEVTEGELRIGERVVNDLAPQERDIAMVFQNYALYPHMSVVRQHRVPAREPAECRRRRSASACRTTAELLGLTEHLKRRPRNLSGGQRQRVAMGRAIVRQPQVFLMDEPLSNLDAKLRVQMRAEITRLQEQLGVTTIYVTHDQVEAMTMGDRIAVMRKGVLQQQGPPEELYDQPANLFVAEFIGSPADEPLPGPVRWGDMSVFGDQSALDRLALRPKDPAWRATVGARSRSESGPEHLLDLGQPTRLCRACAATSGTPRRSPPNGSYTRPSQAQPVVTEDVLEIARDVDEAAVERLEEPPRTTSCCCARGSTSRARIRLGELRVRDRRRPHALLRPRTGQAIR